MRDVQRNKTSIYYANPVSSTENTDEYGNVTGTFTDTYETPKLLKINIGAPKGTIDLERFGLNSQYTRVLCTTNMKLPFQETSVLWIGVTPDKPHNYVVKKILPSLNQLLIGLEEVNVS